MTPASFARQSVDRRSTSWTPRKAALVPTPDGRLNGPNQRTHQPESESAGFIHSMITEKRMAGAIRWPEVKSLSIITRVKLGPSGLATQVWLEDQQHQQHPSFRKMQDAGPHLRPGVAGPAFSQVPWTTDAHAGTLGPRSTAQGHTDDGSRLVPLAVDRCKVISDDSSSASV